MNRVYQFLIDLQDKFSPAMMRAYNAYSRVAASMNKKKNAFSGIFAQASKTVDQLRKKILGLSSVRSKLRLDTSDIDTASRKVGQLFQRFSRVPGSGLGGGGMGGTMRRGMLAGSLGGMMLGGFGGYLGLQGAQALGQSTIGAAMTRGEDQFMLGLMLKDRQKGNALSGRLSAFAKENPVLGATEVFSAARKLLASGFKEGEIIPELKMLGDLSAGSGASLDAITYLYKQIKQNKFAQAQELGPLADYIPVYDELSKMFGKPIAEIRKMGEEGKLTFEHIQKAFQNLTTGNGLYAGASVGLGKEPGGRYKQLLGELEEKGIQLGVKLMPFIVQILDNIPVVADGLGHLSDSVGRLFTMLGIMNKESTVTATIMNTIGGIFDYVGHVIDVVGGIISAFTSSPLAMITVGLMALPAIIGWIKASWIALNVAFAVTPIGAIITAVVAGVVLLGAALKMAWDKFDWFREGVISAWAIIKTVFSNIGSFMYNLLKGDFAAAMTVIGVIAEGSSNARKAVQADRVERYHETLNKRREGRKGYESAFSPVGSGSGSGGLGTAAGISSTVGNSKSTNVTINIKSLIEKSEIHVNQLEEALEDLEPKLIELLLRIANSGARIVTA